MPDVSLFYAIPYFLMSALFFLFVLVDWKVRGAGMLHNLLMLVCPSLFLLFWGFRGFIATDWRVYYPIFTEIGGWSPAMLNASNEDYVEYGYMLLNYICHFVVDSYWGFQFLLTALNVLLLHLAFIKFSPRPIISWWIWASVFLLYHDLMRNIISILIIVLAIRQIEQKCFWKYVGIVLIASAFHKSALLWLPLYFVLDRRFTTVQYGVALVGGAVLCYFKVSLIDFVAPAMNVINARAENYMEGTYSSSVLASFKQLIIIFPLMLCTFLPKMREWKHYNVMVNSLFIYYLSLGLLNGNGEVQRRIGYLFKWSVCMVIPATLISVDFLWTKVMTWFYVVCYCVVGCRTCNNIMWRYENVLIGTPTPFNVREIEIIDAKEEAGTAGKGE